MSLGRDERIAGGQCVVKKIALGVANGGMLSTDPFSEGGEVAVDDGGNARYIDDNRLSPE